jgi:hypothetical protein
MTMPRATRAGRALCTSVLALSLAASTVGCGAAIEAPRATPRPTAPNPQPTPSATPVIDVPVVSSRVPTPIAPVAPVHLVISSIDADMPVVPVGVDAKDQMGLPEDPAVAGWYEYGPDAAAAAGHIVIAAHIDAPQYPIGPLSRLTDLAPGAEVVVSDDRGGSRSFRIDSVEYRAKTELPVDEIFRRDGSPALILITCGGPFDSSTGHYRDNVVATASPS